MSKATQLMIETVLREGGNDPKVIAKASEMLWSLMSRAQADGRTADYRKYKQMRDAVIEAGFARLGC